MALALGARGTSDLVRDGAPSLRVEAIFDEVPRDPKDPLDELVDLGEGTLIVSREVTADGRSLARVNDRTVTVGALAAFGGRIAEIHGQHEHQRLFAADLVSCGLPPCSPWKYSSRTSLPPRAIKTP